MKTLVKILSAISTIGLASGAYASPLEKFSVTYVNNTNFSITFDNDYQNYDDNWSSTGDFNGNGLLPAGQKVTFNTNIYDHYDGNPWPQAALDSISAEILPGEASPGRYDQYNTTYWISIVNPAGSPTSWLYAYQNSTYLYGLDLAYLWSGFSNVDTTPGLIANYNGNGTNDYTITFTGWTTVTVGGTTYSTLAATLSVNNGVGVSTYFAPYVSGHLADTLAK